MYLKISNKAIHPFELKQQKNHEAIILKEKINRNKGFTGICYNILMRQFLISNLVEDKCIQKCANIQKYHIEY